MRRLLMTLCSLGLAVSVSAQTGVSIQTVRPVASSQVMSAANAGACTTNALGCTVIALGGYSALAVQVSANAGGNTLSFEVTNDPALSASSVWVALSMTSIGNSSSTATSTTSTGLWTAPVIGTYARVRLSTLSSGTSTVSMTLTTGAAHNGGGGGSVTACGNTGDVLYNLAGACAGSDNFTFGAATGAYLNGTATSQTGLLIGDTSTRWGNLTLDVANTVHGVDELSKAGIALITTTPATSGYLQSSPPAEYYRGYSWASGASHISEMTGLWVPSNGSGEYKIYMLSDGNPADPTRWTNAQTVFRFGEGQFTAKGAVVAGTDVSLGRYLAFDGGAGSYIDGRVDGLLKMGPNAFASGVTLDVNTADTLTLKNFAGTGLGNLSLGKLDAEPSYILPSAIAVPIQMVLAPAIDLDGFTPATTVIGVFDDTVVTANGATVTTGVNAHAVNLEIGDGTYTTSGYSLALTALSAGLDVTGGTVANSAAFLSQPYITGGTFTGYVSAITTQTYYDGLANGAVPVSADIWIAPPQITDPAYVVSRQALYIGDQTGGSAASTCYAFWYDSPGVRRIKCDGIEAYYNPAFTKYTPGATNFERIILGQWNANVAQIGPEAGGTGTLRQLELMGASLKLDGVTPAMSGTRYLCISTTGVVSSSALACSGT